MMRLLLFIFPILMFCEGAAAQSARVPNYSESVPRIEKRHPHAARQPDDSDNDVIRVDTDLVTIPVRISHRNGKPVPDVQKDEFKIFENGVEQEIAYFSDVEEPFTVALLLDMSYSSVFKLQEIQSAALAFVNQLRDHDRVMVISFDEKVRLLCEPTTNRKVLRYAVEGAKIGSGTSLYSALDMVLNQKFNEISGRRAVVLLSDGVDTSSKSTTASQLLNDIIETDALVYSIRYDTYDDVQKSRQNDAQILYDENDRPYVVDAPQTRGEREADYREAREFLNKIAEQTGGRVFSANSTRNLNSAFQTIATELRKIYSLGYYPTSERDPDLQITVKVRVYRPKLIIQTRERFIGDLR